MEEPLKVLHCIPSLASGGAERQLSILAPAQVAFGYEVHLAYLHAGPYVGTLGAGGVHLHPISARGNHDVTIISNLWRLMGAETPDVVHTWLPQMDILAGAIALLRGVPWVLSERSSAQAYTSRLKERLVRRRLGMWADAVVANSEAGRAIWSGAIKGGALAHVIRNTTPLAEIERAKPARKSEIGAHDAERIVIFVGRLAPEKNIQLLLDVADAVCAASNARFLICGDGPLRSKAEERVAKSTFRDRICLLGERDDVWRLMKASDAFVSTSAFEGQPNAVLEAMACGCPLIVSDIPAHREFLDDLTAAIVPLEENAFVSAILAAMSGSQESANRSVEAKRRILEQTSLHSASAFDHAYRLALSKH